MCEQVLMPLFLETRTFTCYGSSDPPLSVHLHCLRFLSSLFCCWELTRIPFVYFLEDSIVCRLKGRDFRFWNCLRLTEVVKLNGWHFIIWRLALRSIHTSDSLGADYCVNFSVKAIIKIIVFDVLFIHWFFLAFRLIYSAFILTFAWRE